MYQCDWGIENFHGVYPCSNALNRPAVVGVSNLFCFRLPNRSEHIPLPRQSGVAAVMSRDRPCYLYSSIFYSFPFLFTHLVCHRSINEACVSILFLFYMQGMKRNDKNSARDMSDYSPASFDRGGNGKYATGSGGRKGGKGKKFSN